MTIHCPYQNWRAPKGLADLHAKWQAVIDYCRDRTGEDCHHSLRIMGESGRFD
jgi:hypothetical protein